MYYYPENVLLCREKKMLYNMCARMCTYQLRGKNNIIIIITILRTFLSIHNSFKVYTYRLQFYKKRLLKFVNLVQSILDRNN